MKQGRGVGSGGARLIPFTAHGMEHNTGLIILKMVFRGKREGPDGGGIAHSL